MASSMSFASDNLASMSLSSYTDNPHGFSPEILGEAMSVKYQCWHCKMILRNPVQSYCGHRLCRCCMEYLVRNNTSANPVICKLCEEEGAVCDESYVKEDEIFPDNAIRREMLRLPVLCIFPNCDWTGPFKDYESHADSCEFATAVCEVCNETVLKSELAEHVAMHASSHRCPIGCEQEVSSEQMASHLQDNLAQHFEIISKKISSIERALWNTQRPTDGRSILDRISDVDRDIRQLREQFRSAASAAGVAAAGGPSVPASTASAAAPGGSREVHAILNTTNEKLVIYEGVITVLNREVEKLTVQVEAIERTRLLDRELLDTMDRKVRSMERLIAMKDATIAELELRVSSMEQTSYDGTLLWRISDFQKKRQEAISGRATSIYSPPFYTSKTGYKMCSRLYLNGDGMGKGTHVSLFFVVMRGNYDPLLKWPFKQKVTLMFIDQNGRDHVVDAFRPDPTSSSFKRPTTEMNIASGCPLLMPLSSLDSTGNAYVKENTAFIKIVVNTDDLTM